MANKQRFGYVLLILFLPALIYAQKDSCMVQNADTAISNENRSKVLEIVGIALPATMTAYGILSLENHAIRNIDHTIRNKVKHSSFNSRVDDFMQYSPGAAAYILKASGIQSRHSYKDMLIIHTLSTILETSVIYTIKYYTPRRRPDDSNGWSFPSGHTATAFLGAEFLHQEYKDKSIWISVGGYTTATLIGMSRIYKDKHWVSDVLTGAGMGILSTKFVYWIYPHLQRSFGKKQYKKQAVILPGYNNGNLSLNLSYTF